MARCLKFQIYEVEVLYYPDSENKDADQLRGYHEADLRLCFPICKKPVFSRRGSYDTKPASKTYCSKTYWNIEYNNVLHELQAKIQISITGQHPHIFTMFHPYMIPSLLPKYKLLKHLQEYNHPLHEYQAKIQTSITGQYSSIFMMLLPHMGHNTRKCPFRQNFDIKETSLI